MFLDDFALGSLPYEYVADQNRAALTEAEQNALQRVRAGAEAESRSTHYRTLLRMKSWMDYLLT